MELSVNKMRRAVLRLRELMQSTQLSADDDRVLQNFLKQKNISERKIEVLLDFLSERLLDELWTAPIASVFDQVLLLLITRLMPHDEEINASNFGAYQRRCISLAAMMRISTNAKGYAVSYFRNKPPPFECPEPDTNSSNKKFKSDALIQPLKVVKCCYQLLHSNPSFFKDIWNWSIFVDRYMCNTQKDDLKQIYCNHIISILTNMTIAELCRLNSELHPKTLLQFDQDQNCLPQVNFENLPIEQSDHDKITLKINSDLVTNIEGVLLPIFNKENYKFYSDTDGFYDNIVKVGSTKVNLRNIALGIMSAKAICLSGPVGCGKTTIVEYLARKTGRICPKQNEIKPGNQIVKEKPQIKGISENISVDKVITGNKRKTELSDLDKTFNASTENKNGFLRIQLGDQTDSKMLLGQYRCTDVPGEFIWLPGVLTQAVMNGYWLLLEDLDSASQDIYTILSSLLENNFLSVPGFRDSLKISPGFQLFVTVRTNNSSTNSSHKSLFSILEKYLYTINILPLSRNELCKVIRANYPKLATVANRIVDVYLIFSSGDHSVTDNLRQQEIVDDTDVVEKYQALPFEKVSLASTPYSGRLVSTRDLIKLCQRSDPTFLNTSAECAFFVFKNAVDVFCSYMPQSKEKTKLITYIGAKLGIIQSRCEYFADEYKPEIQANFDSIEVGRAKLYTRVDSGKSSESNTDEPLATKRQKLSDSSEKQVLALKQSLKLSSTFSFTRMASCVLERIAVCVTNAEPVLLVGETGVGKTSSVQYLAERTNHKLVVVNMNNQSDVSDLLGGFKPVDLNYVMAPLRTEFEMLFRATFNQIKNETYLTKLATFYNQGNYYVIINSMIKVVNSVFQKLERNELRQKEIDLLPRWQALKISVLKFNSQLDKSINISFAFIPGSLVNCIKNGDWILLDEINLASAETLECLSTILEPEGSVVLLEKGDFTPVERHPDFRIFACMNPNTDIGKKDLPVGIRNRFTEFFVDELTTDADLSLLISDYLKNTGIQGKSVHSLVTLYKRLKQLSKLELNDGLGNRPVFSLRTLCRSLRICAKNLCGSTERNLYESFCMSFLTQLDPVSHRIVLQLIQGALLSNAKAVLKQAIPKPGEDYLNFEGYWIQQGPDALQECSNYILTNSVKENLQDLSRIISIGKLPILLQGPTSAGKTSLIEYVAKRSGNHCLRINNHEHTDLQEYIGTYVADVTGKLSFKEGVLVQAMRNGYWIILDELNLASTDILEALNRVLDDNRELYIPETQTVVKAHPNFMLFATQNPPGLYGGRKTLSRAFKNRFIELHFSEIPRNELEIILEKRCLIPTSYAKKMVMCMSDLQKNRKSTTKSMFTLRDLFRWGIRYTYADKKLLENPKYDWNQHLIEEGYLVLSAKVRTDIEIKIIEETLYKNFRKRIDLGRLFDAELKDGNSPVTSDIISAIRGFKQRADIVWTQNMTRMAVLTAKALQFNEPVLLVGPTGCGKTTVCQILASIRGVQLRILNCHMHTEGADFLGGLRPCRQNDTTIDDLDNGKKLGKKLFEWADGPLIFAMQEGSYFMADEISLAEDSVLERLNCILEPERTVLLAEKGGVSGNSNEIANDFVVQAKDGFQFLATMNPGGDFGKKELSPALRNRFTEIWCIPSDSKADLIRIAGNCMIDNLNLSLSKEDVFKVASYLVEVVLHIRYVVEKFKFSIRDILAWANYIVSNTHLSFPEKAIFGLETIFLDALELLPFESLERVEQLKLLIIDFAIQNASSILGENFTLTELELQRGDKVICTDENFGIKPFFIATNKSLDGKKDSNFLFDAPTTKKNIFRLLSALSLKKPILLEGPPGVGKTSTVESIAKEIGYHIVRINLCEHTDLADLFGTDLPAEDNILEKSNDNCLTGADCTGSFVWRDGPLLAALKAEKTWILLDELNLAPQSVLEGLNAILDHRGEVYIPELNKTFLLNKETRIFACQNPLKQGGGRKGLPQSFLNRFNKVYLRKLTTLDLLHVVNGKYQTYFQGFNSNFAKLLRGYNVDGCNIFELYKKIGIVNEQEKKMNGGIPIIQFDLSDRLVKFSEILDQGISEMEFGYKGGPYEINLRDIMRWCDLLVNSDTGFIFEINTTDRSKELAIFKYNFERFLLTLYERMKLVYCQRMRCEQDKIYIRNAFAKVFNCDAEQLNALSEDVSLYWTDNTIYLNDIALERNNELLMRSVRSAEFHPIFLASQRETLKNIIECVRMEKPVLLCGPSDTGKTKIIDLFCTLSNQICNTDTIDDSVTGSFQQIDLNRHLEELSQNIESILMSHLRSVILESNSYKYVVELLNVWSDYSKLLSVKPESNQASAMSVELTIYRKRIYSLNNIAKALLRSLDACNTTCFRDVLNHQQNILNKLENYVQRADSLNTGGSFEWVDSKFVKSLKNGQYILLEHVNLCSSAVLDRLNPVFEPNGKLLISEKGVASNENAEIVERSANFHAFLTIDPKNGELSRAMRNRCIELALSKDAYDADDLRAIIFSNGVHHVNAINCILSIHKQLLHSTEINNFNVSHLTQFAFLTSSYVRIGYDLKRAIYLAGMEVYVYFANTDLMGYGLAYYQNKLREIVLKGSQELCTNMQSPTSIIRLENVILKSDELNTLSLIKLQVEPLRLLLHNDKLTQNTFAAVFNEFKNVEISKMAQEPLAKFFIYLLYESSTLADIDLRHLYLKNILFNLAQHSLQKNKSKTNYESLQKLSSVLYSCIIQFKQHLNFSPNELPWNNKLFPRIRAYALQNRNSTKCSSNVLSAELCACLLLESIPETGIMSLSDMSALAYSQAVAANKMPERFNNVFLQNLSIFLSKLQENFNRILESAELDTSALSELITAYLWYNRLLSISQEKLLINKQLDTSLMDKLVMHLQWLEKNLLQKLEKVAPDYCQLDPELGAGLQKLTNYIVSTKRPLNLMRKVYNKHLTHFLPYYQDTQVKFYNLVRLLDQTLNVVPSFGSLAPEVILRKYISQNLDKANQAYTIIRSNICNRLDHIFKEAQLVAVSGEHLPKELRTALHQFKEEVTLCEPSNIELSDLNLLESTIHSLQAFVNAPEELLEAEKPRDFEILLITLREYFVIRALISNITNDNTLKKLDINEIYCDGLNSLQSDSWQIIKVLNSQKFKKYENVWSELMSYVKNIKTAEEFEHFIHLMNGSYRNYNSCQQVLLNAAFNIQMNNEACSSNCMRILKGDNEINSLYEYEGPKLLNLLFAILFQDNGLLRPVPLDDLNKWKATLKQFQHLLWQNSIMLTSHFNPILNNFRQTKQEAMKLLREVEYVKTLCDKIENENFSDYNESFQKLVAHLTHVHTNAINFNMDTLNSSNYQIIQYESSLMTSYIGAIEVCLLTFTPLIDPVEKNRLKTLYFVEDINCLKTLTTAYDFMKIVMKYKHFGSEIYDVLEERLKVLKLKQESCSQKLALRPEACLYSKLVQDITHFLNTNCEPKSLLTLVENVQKCWASLTVNYESSIAVQTLSNAGETVKKINIWIANSQRFVSHTLKAYMDYYQDFIQPLRCSIDRLRFGFEGLKTCLIQLRSSFVESSISKKYNNINEDAKLHEALINISTFPAIQKLEIFNMQSSADILKNRSYIYTIMENVAGSEHNYFRLLKAKITELSNLITVSSDISEELFCELDFVFSVSNQIWQSEEERRRKQKAEDESLYKIKCATEDEEMLELQEIEELFPTNFEEDFGDFIVEATLEKVVKLDKKRNLSAKSAQVVNDEDYVFLAENFISIMEKYTRVYYHDLSNKNVSAVPLALVTPFKQRMQTFVQMATTYKCSLNEWVDESTYNSLSFALGLQQQLVNDGMSISDECEGSYNFYKDSNIPEIVSCVDVLYRIEERVTEQLELYPEHASLIDIKRVIERIRKLPATAPVVRFNTGFQILRQKVSQWNEVAHKGNNLQQEEIIVAEYVQRWMKLELQCWRNCLSQTYEQVKSGAYKYWFFIYNLLKEYIQDHAVDSSYTDIKYTEKRFGEGEILDEIDAEKKSKVSNTDIIRILQQFVESANYGDFEVRLRLLGAFEFYLHNIDKNSETPLADEKKFELIAGLRNLQIYFAQFVQEIEDTAQNVRAPIEKKLKELVKIESYNKDLSYFSMRNNVARVHRNLNKFLKEYRQQLLQKITPVFQPQDATVKDYNFENEKGRDLRFDTRIKYYLVDLKHFVAPQKLQEKLIGNSTDEAMPEQALLHKAAKLFKTSRNVVKEMVTYANFPKLIIALDMTMCEQLERCEQLRSLSVDRSKDRPKQKLEAKQILQQKRKGLTDLFKILTELGLSYKSGLMELSLRTVFEEFDLPPFCIKTMLTTRTEKAIHSNVLQMNENLDRYYAKGVFKLKLLQNIMLTPPSELGPPNIERIKGFAIDFFLLLQNQRRLLANSVKSIYDLELQLRQIKEIKDATTSKEDKPHLQFSKFRNMFVSLRHSIGRIRYAIEQFNLLLKCAPNSQSDDCNVYLSAENRLLQGSSYFTGIMECAEEILKRSKHTLADMLANDMEFIRFEKLNEYQRTHEALLESLYKINTYLKTDFGEISPISQPIRQLIAFVEDAEHQQNNITHIPETDFESIDCQIENILHAVLLALQKLYKKYTKDTAHEARCTPSSIRKSLNETHGLEENHLKKKLHAELESDWEVLNMRSIVDKLSKILLVFKHSESSKSKLKCAHKLSTLLPLLEQYHLTADYYLIQQLGAHKVSSKMLSVMLTVFVEIGTKGFCVPPDLMQDEEGQAKKEQKEGEGIGLEDGTGENDASNKIESEDQLDDAKRPEDRKKEEGKEQEDCKEENGIEMSEDFEGKKQDIEKTEEDDSGESENEEELNKEMGETEEGADKLDDQIWGGDEEENEEEDEQEKAEEEGKGSNEEKSTHNDLEAKSKDDTEEAQEENGLDAGKEPNEKQKQKDKNIDDMEEPDVDEDQVNPYHNELEEPPEAEEMELGDMNNDNDEKEDGDEQDGGENPFDIDKMKENMEISDDKNKDDGIEDQKENDDNKECDDTDSESDSGDKDADTEMIRDDNEEEKEEESNATEETEPETQVQNEQQPNTETPLEEEKTEAEKEKNPEEYEQSKDKPSKEENIQSVHEAESKGAPDQVQNEADKDVRQDQKLDEQDTGQEKDGVGQAENEENDGGHQGVADTKEKVSNEDSVNEQKTKEKRKQGKTNEERTLGEAEINKIKQLKTIDKMKEHINNDNEEEENMDKDADAEEYQHVKEPKNSDKTTLDNATEEQSKSIRHQDEEKKEESDAEKENNDELPADDDNDGINEEVDENPQEISGEKSDQKSEKPSKTERNKHPNENPEQMEIEGEIIQTSTAARSDDTTAHCSKEILLDNISQGQEFSTAELLQMKKQYQQQLTATKTGLLQHEDYEVWQSISNRMVQNARELCEQLRLILEPTKCTRLKGDYRTGRRINMKKIIPYIASQFRKDKIWLRRTKPAQRDYKITIAIDDSKSMHHNNSKTLTLEAISLVSQALTLLESGRLSVVSFGESPKIILNHTEQFDGPRLVNSLDFSQDKTKIADMLDFVRTATTEEGSLGSDNGLFENLLLVLSDGRNIFSEGKTKVKNSIKMARLQRIFLVYIIIDNPDNKDSILDIQSMEILPDKRISIKSYLDDFPFPYYVIVRDLNQLPLVLSEAMRQWFELVNSEM